MVAVAESTPSFVQSTNNSPMVNNNSNNHPYQEEMCEKLIQLSFVKIVSSKNERGGARLRKNLLILHLLQKARTEQRNRLFLAARNPAAVASHQNPETTTTKQENVDIDRDEATREEEEAEIDDSALSQQSSTPTRTDVLNDVDGGQTSSDNLSPDDAHIQIHAEPIPICDRNEIDQSMESKIDLSSPSSSSIECSEKDTNNKRSLKRKHESSSDSYSSTPKIACVFNHRSTELFSVLKSAAAAASSNLSSQDQSNGGDANQKNVESSSPLARSLSCSSFMELTCES